MINRSSAGKKLLSGSILAMVIVAVVYFVFIQENLTRSATASGQQSVLVLMYHCVNDKTKFKNAIEESLTITTGNFIKQLDCLEAAGYHVVSINDAYAAMIYGKDLPRNPVVLTFDDGAPDAYSNVYPILNKREISGTFFIKVVSVQNGSGLDWRKVNEMAHHRMQIESHTMTHPDLKSLTSAQLVYELRDSKSIIEKHIKRPVYFLCYPSGGYNLQVIRIAVQSGYRAAFSTQAGSWKSGDALYGIKRIRIPREITLVAFLAMLRNAAK